MTSEDCYTCRHKYPFWITYMTFWRLQCCHKNRLQDTKGIFRNNKSNDRQSNGHMKKRAKKKTTTIYKTYTIHRKLEIEQHKPHLNGVWTGPSAQILWTISFLTLEQWIMLNSKFTNYYSHILQCFNLITRRLIVSIT